MGMNLTRGGLAPAKIINLTTNEEVKCTFNPFEYTLSKNNEWEAKAATGQNVPEVTFKQGGKQTLKLRLHFDTLDQRSDVRNITDGLWKMMMVDETVENPKSGKSVPPFVAFEWGRLYFKAVLTSMSQKFTLFLQDGTPVRCEVDVTLDQLIDVDDYKDQAPASAVQRAPRLVQAVAGDRIDNIASQDGGSPDNWRDVAQNNNINDPLNIPPGTSLTSG